jgi:hypothetical protein
MIILAALLVVGAVIFTLAVRTKDLPPPEPVSPFRHLDERKAAIYENLRDLQFEYRLGKLSVQDYQQTKLDLQRELAAVLAETDRLRLSLGQKPAVAPKPPREPAPPAAPARAHACPHCGAAFDQPLRFCGECGKAMAEEKA